MLGGSGSALPARLPPAPARLPGVELVPVEAVGADGVELGVGDPWPGRAVWAARGAVADCLGEAADPQPTAATAHRRAGQTKRLGARISRSYPGAAGRYAVATARQLGGRPQTLGPYQQGLKRFPFRARSKRAPMIPAVASAAQKRFADS
jgi:hypothetical protein